MQRKPNLTRPLSRVERWARSPFSTCQTVNHSSSGSGSGSISSSSSHHEKAAFSSATISRTDQRSMSQTDAGPPHYINRWITDYTCSMEAYAPAPALYRGGLLVFARILLSFLYASTPPRFFQRRRQCGDRYPVEWRSRRFMEGVRQTFVSATLSHRCQQNAGPQWYHRCN